MRVPGPDNGKFRGASPAAGSPSVQRELRDTEVESRLLGISIDLNLNALRCLGGFVKERPCTRPAVFSEFRDIDRSRSSPVRIWCGEGDVTTVEPTLKLVGNGVVVGRINIDLQAE